MRDIGSLTIKLYYEPHRVQGIRLCIPLLGIDEHLTKYFRFDAIPTGLYDGVLNISLTSGGEIKQTIRLKVLAGQDNLHHFHLAGLEQEVYIKPVDAEGRTIVTAEIKIENVDINFRPIRDWKGLACKLRPGDYQVKIILPNLQMKTLPLHVTAGVSTYTLVAEDTPAAAGTRKEPRFPIAIPVDYQANEGSWVSTRSVNLSSMGICVMKTPSHIDKKETVVRLFLPNGLVECRGKIRWEKEDYSCMGVELLLNKATKESLGDWLSHQPR